MIFAESVAESKLQPRAWQCASQSHSRRLGRFLAPHSERHCVRLRLATRRTEDRLCARLDEPLHAELEHFVQCVRGGNQPSVGGEQALKALRLASLIEQMALDGQAWKPADRESNYVSSPIVTV